MGRLTINRLTRLGIKGGDVLIETGTDGGKHLLCLAGIFNTIHTVELNRKSFTRGWRRMRKRPNIQAHFGNSTEVLPKVIDPKRETVFWLDAHFMGGPVSVGPQCPLMDELQIIFDYQWGYQPIIMVDDARMFGDWYWDRRSRGSGFIREHWPTLKQIKDLSFEYGYNVEEIKGMLLIMQE